MSERRFRIVDGHAHVASTHFIPRAFLAGAAQNIAAQALSGKGRRFSAAQAQVLLEAQHQDHDADQLVKEMDEAGVEKTVLLVPDFSHVLECPLPIAELAVRHHRIQLRHPGRFYVFQGIDPRSGRDGVDFFERTIREYGFNGLKLYPPCGYSPSDEGLFPFYEVCKSHGLPVLLHTGPTSPVLEFGPAHPTLIDRAARVFPDVNFILAHGGVNYVEDASLLCAYRPNVYLDIAGFPETLHPRGWAAQLHDLFRLGINHKVIFGTDWPLSRMTHPTKSCIDVLLGDSGPLAGLPDRVCEAIMGGTIERLIGDGAQSAQQPVRLVARSS